MANIKKKIKNLTLETLSIAIVDDIFCNNHLADLHIEVNSVNVFQVNAITCKMAAPR